MRVVQPAIDKYFSCHPSILICILFTKCWYDCVVRRVVKMGALRYMPMWSVVGIPKMPTTYSFIHLVLLGENHSRNLVTLISWPKDAQRFCRILNKFLQSLALVVVRRKISSVKNKCERCTWPLKFIGWISLSRIASSNMIDNISKQRIKRYGDKGSPCLMSVMRFGGIWKNSSNSLIKDHSNRSYAFSRSNFIATYPFWPCLDFNIRITSWTRIMLSLGLHPDTNPTWQGLISSTI